jgi:uncharacterized repeat protein (TIGR03806 family)
MQHAGAGGHVDSADEGGAAGAAGASEPLLPYGLDERPSNTTCLAPDKPTGEIDDPFPQTLSETGCVDPDDPREPAAGLIYYEVNAPLWSDGAEKSRYLALPDDGSISIGDDGDWDFPNGTVLMKTFNLGDTLVETRLFMRHADGDWAGYSYAWRDDGTDADLLESSISKTFGEQEWVYPSRDNCLECHRDAAGFSLGLETGQLNRAIEYELGRANQLDTLEHIGIFSDTLPNTPDQFPEPFAEVHELRDRARAYLHANCSHCHRPDGVPEVTLDLRLSTPWSDTRTCNVNPTKGNYGLVGAKIVKPGAPESSILSLRMHTEIAGVRMPPIASLYEDKDATGLIDAFIDDLADCKD